jgi:DNA replication and repair protein RecF
VLSRAIGRWLAVVFVPADVALAGGPASERRRYLDRMLSLADASYLQALARYRYALAQRNAALRQGRPDVAQACEAPLAAQGAVLVRARSAWCRGAAGPYAAEVLGLGERAEVGLAYRGREELADPAAWSGVFRESAARDRQRGLTSVGPHRDELVLSLDGRPLRDYGSTGQLRSAAIALKLLELETLRAARATEPALVLDDVFAELDAERQQRLAARLGGGTVRQCFVSAPRVDELPSGLRLPRADVEAGEVQRRDEVVA